MWWRHRLSALSFEPMYLLLLLYNIYLSYKYTLSSNKQNTGILEPKPLEAGRRPAAGRATEEVWTEFSPDIK